MEKNIPSYLKHVKMNGKLNALNEGSMKFKTYKYVISQDEIREIEEQYLAVSYELFIDRLNYKELIAK